jgi:hypothetical protein
MNNMLMGNDVVLQESDALDEGEELDLSPGAVNIVRPNKLEKIRRLGNLTNSANAINTIDFIHSKIEETTGNSVSANGVEPMKVTTATGIAQLNERADARKGLKKYDRLKGFEELYKLIDLTALEFYDDNRTIIIRGKTKTEQDKTIQFDSANHLILGGENGGYFPTVDVEISAGDGLSKSKAFTVQVISDLIKTPITPQNVGIIEIFIDLLELPNGDELKNTLRQSFSTMPPGTPPVVNPEVNPQNNPQMTENGGQGDIVDQIFSTMTPEEQKLFQSKTPQEQQQIIESIINDMQPQQMK